MDYKGILISIEHQQIMKLVELTAQSETEAAVSAATMPKAAIKARATGEKDFMIGEVREEY